MELHSSNSLAVIPECFVRSDGEVEIVPEETLVVRSDDEVISAGMHVEGRDPTCAGLDDFKELLLGKIVAADHALGCDEEDGFRGVELSVLGETSQLPERKLGEMFG